MIDNSVPSEQHMKAAQVAQEAQSKIANIRARTDLVPEAKAKRIGDVHSFPDALRSKPCRAWVSSSRWARSISGAVAGSNPAWRAAWYSAAIVCCSRAMSVAASAIRAASVSAPRWSGASARRWRADRDRDRVADVSHRAIPL